MSYLNIYERIYKARRPYQLPGAWAHLTACADCFCLPENPQELLLSLEKEFGRDAVLASKVALPSPDSSDALVWTDALADPVNPIWAARAYPGGEILMLVARGLCVDGQKNNALTLALEERDESLLLDDIDPEYVVANSMVEFAILRSLKIASLPGPGHFSFGRKSIRRLMTQLEIPLDFRDPDDPTPSRTHFGTEPTGLVFVNWNLAELKRGEVQHAKTAWEAFEQFQSATEVDLTAFRLWNCSDRTLQKIRAKLKFCDSRTVEIALQESIEQDGVPFCRTPQEPLKPKTFFDFYAQLDGLHRPASGSWTSPSVLEKLQAMRDDLCIAPLLELASRTRAPVKRAMIETAAFSLRWRLPVIHALAATLRYDVSQSTNVTEFSPDNPLIATLSQLTSETSKTLKDLHTCLQKPRSRREKAPAVRSNRWSSTLRRRPH